MFKRVENKLNEIFDKVFFKRFLIVAIIVCILLSTCVAAFSEVVASVFVPDESVYSHFNQLATDVIRHKNTDFLQNSDILNYYTITENSKENTISIELYGYNVERLSFVVTSDYNLLSVSSSHDNFFVLALSLIGVLALIFSFSALISFIFNLLIIGLKYAYKNWIIQYCERICEYFKNLREKRKEKYQFEEEYYDEEFDYELEDEDVEYYGDSDDDSEADSDSSPDPH